MPNLPATLPASCFRSRPSFCFTDYALISCFWTYHRLDFWLLTLNRISWPQILIMHSVWLPGFAPRKLLTMISLLDLISIQHALTFTSKFSSLYNLAHSLYLQKNCALFHTHNLHLDPSCLLRLWQYILVNHWSSQGCPTGGSFAAARGFSRFLLK